MVIGDFNSIRMHFEALGSSPVPIEMEEFNHVILEVNLSELTFQGNWLTWTSKV